MIYFLQTYRTIYIAVRNRKKLWKRLSYITIIITEIITNGPFCYGNTAVLFSFIMEYLQNGFNNRKWWDLCEGFILFIFLLGANEKHTKYRFIFLILSIGLFAYLNITKVIQNWKWTMKSTLDCFKVKMNHSKSTSNVHPFYTKSKMLRVRPMYIIHFRYYTEHKISFRYRQNKTYQRDIIGLEIV